MKFIPMIFFISLIYPALGVAASVVTEKTSLLKLSQQLKKGPEISKALLVANKTESESNAALAEFIKANELVRAAFFSTVKAQGAFVRGEIEDEKVLNFVTNLLQLSILKIRLDLAEHKVAAVGEETMVWFNFAADLSYEESSLVGLRLANLVRSLLLDELEAGSFLHPQTISESGVWMRGLRAPWPVDRVFLFESKRILKPQSLAVAEKVAKAFQKNAYQTAEQILKKIPGGAGSDLEFLKSIWREADLKAMKTEINRVGLLKARAADLHFEITQKKKASTWDELKKTGGLELVPTDYFTGRPMEWALLTATRVATPAITK